MTDPAPIRSVTLKDIAKALGLSRTTIAMALKDAPKIAESTRQRVQKAAKEMGYEPNPMATSLAHFRQRSKTQPIRAALAWLNLWPDPKKLRSFRDFDEYWKGAYTCAEKFGYRLEEFVWDGNRPLEQLEQILIARGISGILLPPHQHEPNWNGFQWEKFSVVRLSRSETMPKVHTVTADHVANTMMAADAIAARGYKRIGFFTPQAPRDRKWLHEAGFLMAQLRMASSDRLRILQDADRDQQKFVHWLEQEKPDAILTACKETKEMLQRAGYRIPQDIALASMSSLDGNAEAGVDQNSKEIGRGAILVLLSLIHDNDRGIPASHREILIKGEWVDGKSLPPCSGAHERKAQSKVIRELNKSPFPFGSHEMLMQSAPNHAFFGINTIQTTFA